MRSGRDSRTSVRSSSRSDYRSSARPPGSRQDRTLLGQPKLGSTRRYGLAMAQHSDGEPAIGELVAFWPPGTGEEQRDAHHRAQRWAHVLGWQIERLYSSRRHAMKSHEQVLAAGNYPDEARLPFFEMEADAQFALVVAPRSCAKGVRRQRSTSGPALPMRRCETFATRLSIGTRRVAATPPSDSSNRELRQHRTNGVERGRGSWVTSSRTKFWLAGATRSTTSWLVGIRMTAGGIERLGAIADVTTWELLGISRRRRSRVDPSPYSVLRNGSPARVQVLRRVVPFVFKSSSRARR